MVGLFLALISAAHLAVDGTLGFAGSALPGVLATVAAACGALSTLRRRGPERGPGAAGLVAHLALATGLAAIVWGSSPSAKSLGVSSVALGVALGAPATPGLRQKLDAVAVASFAFSCWVSATSLHPLFWKVEQQLAVGASGLVGAPVSPGLSIGVSASGLHIAVLHTLLLGAALSRAGASHVRGRAFLALGPMALHVVFLAFIAWRLGHDAPIPEANGAFLLPALRARWVAESILLAIVVSKLTPAAAPERQRSGPWSMVALVALLALGLRGWVLETTMSKWHPGTLYTVDEAKSPADQELYGSLHKLAANLGFDIDRTADVRSAAESADDGDCLLLLFPPPEVGAETADEICAAVKRGGRPADRSRSHEWARVSRSTWPAALPARARRWVRLDFSPDTQPRSGAWRAPSSSRLAGTLVQEVGCWGIGRSTLARGRLADSAL